MTLSQVNHLNSGLMVVSLVAAFYLPFELFLLSYAILGPLHYMTEISWLHDRNYFMAEKWMVVPIGLLTLSVLVTSNYFPSITIAELRPWHPEAMFAALALALMFVVTRRVKSRLIGSAVVIAATVAAHYINAEVRRLSVAGVDVGVITFYDVFFAILLTTIIHVFVFTGAFVLFGALKGRSPSGYLSLAIFIGCAAACFVVPAEAIPRISEYTYQAYNQTSASLSFYLMNDPSVAASDGFNRSAFDRMVYQSPTGVMVARFIAFAYTYHYLNWFSKTSVIKWHEVPRLRLVLVVVVWVLSIVLYGIDYTLGLKWLLLLSLLHVFLEFPLNWQSLFGIGRELYQRARPA